ncbi:hypothetical protein LP419_25390 [Massilia sp. H-1]|nr:hypothetical protein LP419_25390 [Massilia sp. H-1]
MEAGRFQLFQFEMDLDRLLGRGGEAFAGRHGGLAQVLRRREDAPHQRLVVGVGQLEVDVGPRLGQPAFIAQQGGQDEGVVAQRLQLRRFDLERVELGLSSSTLQPSSAQAEVMAGFQGRILGGEHVAEGGDTLRQQRQREHSRA